jgi:uncharacterized protein YndB with AHSA1/START domain
MPRVSRSRVIDASPQRVWELVSDPYNLPRWWPKTTRVEDVREGDRAEPSAWTTVLMTERGAPVRADFRCAAFEPGTRMRWEQEVEGTPFERILNRSAVEVALAAEGATTKLTLVLDERLRGLARLGSLMIGGAAKRRLDEALEGVERAVAGSGA